MGAMSSEGAVDEAPARPLLRVVKGDPTPEELAALIAVLAARSGGAAPAPEPVRSAWSRPGFNVRTPLPVGPSAWRESGRVAGLRTNASW